MFGNDPTCPRPLAWLCSAKSDRGSVRKVNEDAWLRRPEIGLWAVADGMGGHQVGDLASRMVVEALHSVPCEPSLSPMVDAVEARLMQANCDILAYAEAMFAPGAIMGTTVASLILKGRAGSCLWMGDSRLYRWRSGQLCQLTRDHSQVQEMVDLGILPPAQAYRHPQAHVITRAVGVQARCFVDLTAFDAQFGDVFLLCSDGLTGAIAPQTIAGILPVGSADDATEALIDAALGQGASDNVTAVVVKCVHGAY